MDKVELPQAPPEFTRRQMLAMLIAAALGTGLAWKFIFGNEPSQASPIPLNFSGDTDQQLDQELSATATAGSGQEIVGNAIGVIPAETLRAAQIGTGIIVVVFEDLTTSQGTGAFITSSSDRHDNSRLILTAAHVATSAGRQPTSNISQIWFGRPHIDSKLWAIGKQGLSVEVPDGYQPDDLSRDIGVVRIHPDAVPAELQLGASLPVGNITGMRPDTTMMIAGFSGQFVGRDGSTMRSSELNVSLAPVVNGPYSGVVTVRSEQGHGSSGAPLITESGQVVGVNVSGVKGDRFLELATTTQRADELIAATW